VRKLYLVRHGETEWNRAGRFQGHTDVELSDVGREQARALAERLRSREINVVAASDLRRARETAEIIAQALNVPLACVDAGLRERGYGCFEGLTREECAQQFPELWEQHAKGISVEVPGAERRELVMDRIVRAVKRTIDTHTSIGSSIAIVSHGGVMRAFLEATCGARVPPVPNTAVYSIEYDDTGRFRTPRQI
jgi:broad specificity phosphatase PhoE